MTNLDNRKLESLTVLDANLVDRAASRNAEAFGLIVERYQNLVCSVICARIGNRSQSEDIAQETFVAAWGQLPELKEPEKLRSWLCGIARNLTNNWLRRNTRNIAETNAVECVEEPSGSANEVPEHVIQKEEEAILWQTLQSIPEIYREPLVLYYRENESTEAVARALELSEETVRQRLSRGRKLLHGQVASRVEGTLKRTVPGKAFTLGVLAALPAFTTSATAATVASSAAKGSLLAKSAFSVSFFSLLAGPFLGLLGSCVGIRASVHNTKSPRERAFVVRVAWMVILLVLVFGSCFGLLLSNAKTLVTNRPGLFVGLLVSLILGYIVLLVSMIIVANRRQQKIRNEDNPVQLFTQSPNREYRSSIVFLGLPLIHVKLGNALGQSRSAAKGWIAVGDSAIGILLAVGGVAVGGIAIGGVSLGIVSLAGLALGGFACGGFAFGWMATGGGAVAWNVAVGGLAVAYHYAKGGLALAAHTNDSAALAYFNGHFFQKMAGFIFKYSKWSALLALVPLMIGLLRKHR